MKYKLIGLIFLTNTVLAQEKNIQNSSKSETELEQAFKELETSQKKLLNSTPDAINARIYLLDQMALKINRNGEQIKQNRLNNKVDDELIKTTKRLIAEYEYLVSLKDEGVYEFIEGSKRLTAPEIIESNIETAMNNSFGKNLSIYVEGSLNSKDAKEVAKILANSFANRKYTTNPIYIQVYFSKSNPDKEAIAVVFMNGERYSYNNSDIFLVKHLGGGIQKVCDDYKTRYGTRKIITEEVPAQIN